MQDKLGLYIHIPFCRSKCSYCDFYSCPSDEATMDAYCKAVAQHMKETARYAKTMVIDSIYIGGGTPSYFGAERLRFLLGQVHRRFRIARDAEITVECNPDSVDEKFFKVLARAGVNRVSLGAQSAVDAELKAIGRIHDFEQVRRAVLAARAAKIQNISLDVIYGLPEQTLASLQYTLAQIIALEPSHISCYGLKVEEGTPLFDQVEQGYALPSDDVQADMYLYAVEALAQNGYRQYEISNFARPGMQSRHNLKYWMGRDYVGFGPGAHSCFGGRRYSIIRDTQAYIDALATDEALFDEDEVLDQWARACEYLMLRLRTVRGIEEWEYRREFFMNFEPIERKLFELELSGYVVRDERRWHLTPKGFLVSNVLIGMLLDLQEEQRLDTFLPHVRRDFQNPDKPQE